MREEASERGHGSLRVWWPWWIAVLFLLWQVDFQFAYSFFADSIQREFQLTAFETAAISLAYLLAYGLMQLPAGILLDRFGARHVLPIAAALSALSVFLFSEAQGFPTLLASRILAGTFMAFVFPGTGKIARNRLPARRFALAMADSDEKVTLADLQAAHHLQIDAVGWPQAFDRLDPADRSFLQRAEETSAPISAPRIRISTIHGAKGGEAENVMLFTDMARRTYDSSLSEPDDERRVFYVGATRAKESLVVVRPRTPLHFKI